MDAPVNIGQENETAEFKVSLAQLDKGLKSLTAMLNRHGKGSVWFGVDDDGDVIGLEIGEKTFPDIRSRASAAIAPKIACELKEHRMPDGKSCIEISAAGHDIPYAFDGRYYWRNGAADELASRELLRKMLLSRPADIIREIPSELQDLTFSGLCGRLAASGRHASDTPEFRQSFGLVNRAGKLNLTAYLLSDQNRLSIKVVRFQGKDKSALSTRTEYSRQCLLLSVREVLEFFSALNTTQVSVANGERIEIPLFPYEAFREAWINAALHCCWQDGIPPAVYLFDDRIEIVSNGGLPYGLSSEAFFAGESRPVNPGLLAVFQADSLAEQTGRGNPTIVANCGEKAFSLESGLVKVAIPFAYIPAFVLIRNSGNLLTEKQKAVLAHLSAHPCDSLPQTAAATGQSLAGVKKTSVKLQEAGLLERSGSRRAGKWIVKVPDGF